MKKQFFKIYTLTMTVCLVIIYLFCVPVFAQSDGKDINLGKEFSLQSKILNEERTFQVYFPDTYDGQSTNYPVIYLLDGGFHFKHCVGSAHFLASISYMPEAIVVAIPNTDRNRDFTPTQFERLPNSGGGENFHKFLNEELIPYVDENFMTNSYKILIGHSLGGLFAIYSLLEYPEVFNTYIAISPFLMYHNNFIVEYAKEKLKKKYNPTKNLYMTLGEEPQFYDAVNELVGLIEEINPKNFNFHYEHMTKEKHNSIPHLSIYHGFENVFSGWEITPEVFSKGLKSVDKHYNGLSKQFDIEISTPEAIINILGYTHLNKGETKEAIEVFQENVNRYPLSANVYDSLGEAYEKNGDIDLAVENYENALKIGKKTNHQFLKTFESNLERAKKSISNK